VFNVRCAGFLPVGNNIHIDEYGTVASPEASTGGNRSGETIFPLAHERIEQMLAASPAVIYTTKASGGYACTFVSENIRAIIGFSPEEMTTDPKHWPDNLHPQDALQVIDKVSALVQQGGGTVEYRFRHREGHYIWIQDTFKVLQDEAGNPFELVGAWADISERKLAQEALQTAYDELEKRVAKRTAELKAGQQRLEYVLAVSPAITYATAVSEQISLSRHVVFHSLQRCKIPSAISTVRPRSSGLR
jgi:PAS domain S-box-containing protein